MSSLMVILLSALLTENVVLSKFLGICPFLGVSKKRSSAIGMSFAVIFVMAITAIVTYPIFHYLLIPNDLEYMKTLIFILVIASLVQLVELILKKQIPALYKSLGVYLPLITTNCAVLGVALINTEESYTFLQSLVNSVGAGFGFMLALILFSSVREKLDSNDQIPDFLKGLPISLISASIISVAFMGFARVATGIFGG